MASEYSFVGDRGRTERPAPSGTRSPSREKRVSNEESPVLRQNDDLVADRDRAVGEDVGGR
jgi:hypothetical protein